jgi:hypothetical protein
MLEFIQGIHLIVSLMLLYILLKYYNSIKKFFNNKCLKNALDTCHLNSDS